jgi:hypothetical protein
MFQQTVVTVSNVDQPSDTTRWGETANQEEIEDRTTSSDQERSMEDENDMTEDNQDDKEESSYDTEHEDTKAYATIVKTINTLPDNHYARGYFDPTKAYCADENNMGTESNVNRGKTYFINWYDMQIHNMAEIKSTQFLMDHYGGLTMDADASQEANPANGTSSKIEQEEPEKGEDKMSKLHKRITQPAAHSQDTNTGRSKRGRW